MSEPGRRISGMLSTLLLLASGSAHGSTQASAFFDDTVVQEIRLTLDPNDWASLQQHFLEDTYYRTTFTWNGVTETIGIKSRGSGSRSPIKPNLTVKFSKYVKLQTFLGLDAIALKANNQDASNLREWFVMKLFRKMGLPSPREAPARLYVNDEYLGFYTIVEYLDETFLQRNFGEASGYLYEWNAPVTYNFDNLGADPSLYEQFLELKTNQSSADLQNFANLVQIINRPASPTFTDADFVAALSQYLNPKLFLTYAAIETYVDDADGILNGILGMNNFYLYQFQGQALYQIIAWDKDITLNYAYRYITDGITGGVNINLLAKRLIAIPEYNEVYLSALQKAATLSGGAGGWADREMSQQYALIRDFALNDPNKQCTSGGVIYSCGAKDFENSVESARTFLSLRSAIVLSEVTSAGYRETEGNPIIARVAIAVPDGAQQLSPGVLANVWGANLGSAAQAGSLPLPRMLTDTFVAVEGVRAPLIASSAGQIEIQAPWGLSMGSASVAVSVNGALSNTIDVRVKVVTPAILGVLHNNGAAVDPSNPVAQGETVSIYLIGFGEVTANLNCGAAGPRDPLMNTAMTPRVDLHGVPMTTTFSGLAPGFAGLYQINAEVPANLPSDHTAMLTIAGGGESTAMAVALP